MTKDNKSKFGIKTKNMKKFLLFFVAFVLCSDAMMAQGEPLVKEKAGALIRLALSIADHPKCNYDDAQKEYLQARLADIDGKRVRDSTLNLWNEEIEILTTTLDERQLKLLFVVKNGKTASRKVSRLWRTLAAEELTATLDSAKEWKRAFQFVSERMLINDIYRFKSDERRQHLADLKMRRPLLVRMYDAISSRKAPRATVEPRRGLTVPKLEFGSVAPSDSILGKAITTLKHHNSAAVEKENALSTLCKSAENDSNSVAMNALAVAYITGAGVAADTVKAVYWFQRAMDSGNAVACYNLGMAYKYGMGGLHQDFKKAYKCFLVGAGLNSTACHYALGFMLYKGLGGQQSYTEAVSHFQIGAQRMHPHSLYMLGLCYRNGFGVERDEAKGNSYLRQADLLGNGAAAEELANEVPENDIFREVTNTNTPLQMPDISTEFTDLKSLSGEYEGILVKYDWSGQFVLCEKPIELSLISKGQGVDGNISIDEQMATFSAIAQNDGRLHFSSGEIRMQERYSGTEDVKYRLDSAVLDAWHDRISGRLELYSMLQKEPERPMYIELYRKKSASAESQDRSITVANSSFDSQLTVNFDLDEDVPSVEMRLFDRSGMLIEKKILPGLAKGIGSVSLTPAVPHGLYVLNVKAGSQMLRTLVIKKGGAE